MSEAYDWFLVIAVREFLVIERSSHFPDRGLQTIERRWNFFGENSTGHRAAVPHHLAQSDCHIAEHRDVGVSRAGKSD